MPTWFIWPYRWNLHNTFNLHYAVVPAFPISFCIRIDETSRYLLEGEGVRRFLFWWEEIIWFLPWLATRGILRILQSLRENQVNFQFETTKIPTPPQDQEENLWCSIESTLSELPPSRPLPSPIASLWPRGSISKPNFTAGLLTLPVSASPLSNPPGLPGRVEFKTWPGHCVLFLGKALSSLRSGV